MAPLAGRPVVVAGGGHNGMIAAALAAAAGARVVLLEAADHLGGATAGERLFDGWPVRLSRYSYLVSLFPVELVERLDIQLTLAPRSVSSYTPVPGTPGLLVERPPGPATARSFRELTGTDADFQAWQQLGDELGAMARVVAPALIGPLRSRTQVRRDVVGAGGEQIWQDVVEAPIGEMIIRRFADDTVRGVVATDALIGTHTSVFDPSLLANRCFLYHLVGRGTGDWLVPVGGMGALGDALRRRCAELGVEVHTSTEVVSVAESDTDDPGQDGPVHITAADGREWWAAHLLAAVAPAVLDRWLGRAAVDPEGAQLKVNMLLRRLPRLKSGVDRAIAFAGTMHLSEGLENLEAAYRASCAGELPYPLPAEVYCHSLTDDSIMNGAPGATLTLFGLHTPARLFTGDGATGAATARDAAVAAALGSLQLHLAEPLEDCLQRDSAGNLCLDVATPVDLERDLRMPGGHIFHGDLQWPWLDEDQDQDWDHDSSPGTRLSTARRYGVAVNGCQNVLLAGSGSVRGGAVSGLGGLAAVDALIEECRTGG